MADKIKFVIPIAPVTKKNNQRIARRGNKKYIIPSEAYENYEKSCLLIIPAKYRLKIDYPINLKAIYYVKRNGIVDKTNLESSLCDALQRAGVIINDSAIKPNIIVGTDGSRVYYDKNNPRTEIEITRMYLNDKGEWEHDKEFTL